jgi:hypothetical protein
MNKLEEITANTEEVVTFEELKYVLDKSKRIIGKRIPADKIQDFINFYERKK